LYGFFVPQPHHQLDIGLSRLHLGHFHDLSDEMSVMPAFLMVSDEKGARWMGLKGFLLSFDILETSVVWNFLKGN